MVKKIPLRAFPELDSIRTASIVMVIFFHHYTGGDFLLNWLKTSGWIGVDIFFVLSGFVITSSLLKEHNIKRFWFNRAVRLLPGYLLFLGVYFGVIYFRLQEIPVTKIRLQSNWWHHLSYFSNYSNAYFGKIHEIMSHFWSLSVEGHFYLFWPVLLPWVLRFKWDKKIFSS